MVDIVNVAAGGRGSLNDSKVAASGSSRLLDSRLRPRLVGNVQLNECELVAGDVSIGIGHLVEVSPGRDDAVMPLPAPVMNQTLLRLLPLIRSLLVPGTVRR